MRPSAVSPRGPASRAGALALAGLLVVLAACGTSPGPSPTPTSAGYRPFEPPAELLAAAETEAGLTTIALPRDFCNYGRIIDTFTDRAGLPVSELAPNSDSGDALEAIRASRDGPGPQAPDVVDLGHVFGPVGKDEGLLAPYRVATWDSIPDAVKDPDGHWYGDYFGVLAFEVNTSAVTAVPLDWADLLDPAYAGAIALPGDPRRSSQAMFAVYGAALATGGSLDDAGPGLEFFRQLHERGNLVTAVATAASTASGATPITIRWTYNALPSRDATADAGGPEIRVVVPASGRIGGLAVQGISAHAPHPSAARLWMEYLYSDEGQNLFLDGSCHPIRFERLVADGVVTASRLAALPDVTGTQFPSVAQQMAARQLVADRWDAVVGADIRQ